MQRSQIQGELRNWRNPSRLKLNELLNNFEKLVSIEIWQSDPEGGFFKPLHIRLWSEHPDLSFLIFIGFHSLETLNCIMKGWVKRMDRNSFQRYNRRSSPSFLMVVIDHCHMIRRAQTETKSFRVKRRKGFEVISFVNGEMVGLVNTVVLHRRWRRKKDRGCYTCWFWKWRKDFSG